jgi:4-amino-4-deoxy-L-arabinose transferase-like glycosyltransferase
VTATTLAPVSAGVPIRRRAYALERWLDLAYLIGVLTAVAIVTGWGLNHYPALNGDEGIYVAQAHAVLHGSIAPYTYTYDHPFLGWAQMSVFAWLTQVFHLGGDLSVINTRFVMLGYALVNSGLLYGIARRLDFRRSIAAATVLLFALSPLTVDLARQIYLDNIAVPWVMLAVFLLLNPRRSQWLYVGAAAAFAVGVLSKETVLLFLPGLVYLLVQRVDVRLRAMAYTATGMMLVLVVALYPLFAVLRNELLPGKHHVSLWSNGIMYQLANRSSSGSLWQAGSARQQLWHGWMHFDGVLLYVGLGAAVLAVATKELRPFVAMLAGVMLPVVKPGGYLPSMYIIAALPLCALLVGGVFSTYWTRIEHWANTLHGWLSYLRLTAATCAFAVVAGAVALVTVHHYSSGDHMMMHTDDVKPYAQAEQWLIANAAPATINGQRVVQNVVTDDDFSTDLYRMGLTPWQAVSYYKYDLDPSAYTKLPGGYHDVTFITDTPQMRGDIIALHLKRTQDAIDHSRIVATFGAGDSRIEMRQVVAQ